MLRDRRGGGGRAPVPPASRVEAHTAAPQLQSHAPATQPGDPTVTEVKLAAVARTEFGKGAARRIRRAHQVPAVLYGHGAAPLHITLPGHETMMALKHANALLTVQVPIRVVGESAPGTIHLLETQSAHIEAEATNLPDHLEVSVEGLVAGVTLRASDLQLPAGVIYLGDPDDVIVAISVPQSEEEPEEGEAGEPTEAALDADASDEEE